MKILVCIKQVPFIDQLKFDSASRRLIREGVESEINPFDKRAITKAVELKKEFGGEVIILTMGPPQARNALVEALAMGADRAVHLLGREFAGADTLATARTLARACVKIGFDLVFCGKYSTDAETAQVPPMLAEILDLPQVTGATELHVSPDGKSFSAVRELDDGFQTIESTVPAVLSAAERLCKPIKVTPADLETAGSKPIEVWGAADLGGDASAFGLNGSPTWVEEIDTIEPKRKQVVRTVGDNVDQVVDQVVRDLMAAGLFGEARSQARQPIQLSGKPTTTTGDKSIWVVAELEEDKIRPVTFELLGRSAQLAQRTGGSVAALLIGHGADKRAGALVAHGADRVYIADWPALGTYSTEAYCAIIADAVRAQNPFAVLFPSTANGRDLAPRVAARLNVGLTGDCIGLDIDEQTRLVQLKPAFGGNIVAPIMTKTRPAMATVRPGMLQQAEPNWMRHVNIERLAAQVVSTRARVVKTEINAVGGVALDDAEVVVGVGMGIGVPEKLGPVRDLAAALSAPIGATRRAVDAGWFPRQLQVGLTGRSISPRLYVAVGISGKFNHVVGIQRAGLVLAINNNPNADIFKQADYGIVGDWALVVPALTRAIKDVRK